MSNKANVSGKVPQLRFPEFDSEWEFKKLSSKVDLISGMHLAPGQYGIDGEIPYFTGPSDFTNSISDVKKWTSHSSNKAERNDVLITVKGNGVGELWYLTLRHVALGRQLMAVRAKKCESQFINQLLETRRTRFQTLAAGNLIPGLSRNDILKMELWFPWNREQQKIADCLSSIDEDIVAQTQKFDGLKAHKKGLMQQLFPAEGETVPKLRFPEFCDAPEWEPYSLGTKVIKVGSGITPRGGDKNYRSKGRPFVRSQNVGWGVLILDDIVYIDEPTHESFSATETKEGDVFLNITGASIGRSAVADYRVAGGNVNQHVCIIRTRKKELNPVFLNQYLLSAFGQSQIDSFQAGGNRQGLNFGQVRSFAIPMPPTEEQEKVATCLSSIDQLIAAQSEKITSLNAHKKGLMQQLFPWSDEARA